VRGPPGCSCTGATGRFSGWALRFLGRTNASRIFGTLIGAIPRPEWIYEVVCAETGRAGLAQFLRSGDRPTAACCANEIAFGVVNAAHVAGLRCPEDISVVGFDDGLWANACHPALTTVTQPLADMAERAVGYIVEAASSPGRSNRARLDEMPAPIVIRESTMSVRDSGKS
jgi:DNA-binding LacI/PurR family transcriptional regulator